MDSTNAESADWTIAVAQSRQEREAVFRFRYECWSAAKGPFPSSAIHGSGVVREVADEGAVLLLASCGDRAVGTARLQAGTIPIELARPLALSEFRGYSRQSCALIDQVLVSRAFYRPAVGDALVRAAGREADRRGARFLFCLESPDQSRYFATLGFRVYLPIVSVPGMGERMPLVRAAHREDEAWLSRHFLNFAGPGDPFSFVARREETAGSPGGGRE